MECDHMWSDVIIGTTAPWNTVNTFKEPHHSPEARSMEHYGNILSGLSAIFPLRLQSEVLVCCRIQPACQRAVRAQRLSALEPNTIHPNTHGHARTPGWTEESSLTADTAPHRWVSTWTHTHVGFYTLYGTFIGEKKTQNVKYFPSKKLQRLAKRYVNVKLANVRTVGIFIDVVRNDDVGNVCRFEEEEEMQVKPV